MKFDFLGLKTLTVIQTALDLVNRERAGGRASRSTSTRIPLDDADVYKLIARGDTTGVFQLESSGFREMLKKLKPDCFEDIVAAGALYRPGPLEGGMVDDFIDRKHGRKKVEYPHPSLEPILKDTYGVIVYQEQVMQIAQVLARLLARRRRPASPRHGQEEGRGDGQAEGRLPRRRARRTSVDAKIAERDLRPDGEVRRLRLQPSHSAAYGLRHLPDRVPQGPLPASSSWRRC